MSRLVSVSPCPSVIALAAAIVCSPLLGAAPQSPLGSPAAGAAPAISFDVVVTDREGRAPDSLDPADLTVSVDGKPRRVLAIRRITRGPGALSDASARLARRTSSAGAFAAESSRTVLVIVDENGLVRGQERQAVVAVRALLDRLGMADRMAALRLPLARAQLLSLTSDQPSVREALAGVTGRIVPSLQAPPEAVLAEPDPNDAANPNVDHSGELLTKVQAAPPTLDMTQSGAEGSLAGLSSVLEALRSVPGRKTIALFSAGVMNLPPMQVTSLAASAVSARAVIHVFGLTAPQDGLKTDPDAGPLELLAASTGGRFVALGRNPDRVIGRTVTELASCFVVSVEGAAADTDGKRHALRVDLANRVWAARAPAWLVPTPDAEDVDAAPPEAALAGAGTPAPGSEGVKPARISASAAAREAELQLAMGRLDDYVDAYERQYSGLVAEEYYRQSGAQKGVRLRSDYLLVRLENPPRWISFRDVFEVNGVAVRDRDDRLRRLFLEPGALDKSQLQAIQDESARYNVGAVERNINVPLFTLRFLAPENRERFRFKVAGRRQSGGVDVWRVEFEELTRPTIITDLLNRDVPAKGWFLVDQTTGAIVESALRVEEHGATGEIIVSFRHDPELGMWVPAQMTETYNSMVQRSLAGLPRLEAIAGGTASYTKFRRFQVKTEETITIPK